MSRATDVTGKLKGPVVPLNVCFTEEGKVDHTSMRRYANWLCEQQTPVLLPTPSNTFNHGIDARPPPSLMGDQCTTTMP